MKLTLRAWNAPYECLQSEEDSLYNLDRYNKTRYSRRKKQEGLLELASREAHERQEVYFATILNDDGSPYCAMESNVGYLDSTSSEINTKTICYMSIGKMSIVGSSS